MQTALRQPLEEDSAWAYYVLCHSLLHLLDHTCFASWARPRPPLYGAAQVQAPLPPPFNPCLASPSHYPLFFFAFSWFANFAVCNPKPFATLRFGGTCNEPENKGLILREEKANVETNRR